MSDNSDPAFPQHAKTGNMDGWRHGMTLRDYIATHALVGLFHSPNWDRSVEDWEKPKTLGRWQEHAAEIAYGYADAMLKARVKP